MAIVVTKKDAGGGWIECTVGTNHADSSGVSERMTIGIYRINVGAYLALGNGGQADINDMGIGGLYLEPFD